MHVEVSVGLPFLTVVLCRGCLRYPFVFVLVFAAVCSIRSVGYRVERSIYRNIEP